MPLLGPLKICTNKQTAIACILRLIHLCFVKLSWYYMTLWKLKEFIVKYTRAHKDNSESIFIHCGASCMWINDLKQRNKLPQRVFLVFSTSERYRIQKYCHSAATALLCMWEHWELRGEEENGDLSESNLVMGFNETQIWFSKFSKLNSNLLNFLLHT